MALHDDPAEQGSLRFFYRNRRPTWFGRFWSAAFAWLAGLGLLPPLLLTLQVKARDGAEICSVVLAVATHEGHRYLVSMLGDESEWVKNVRSAEGRASIKRGALQPVRLIELPPQERAPILKAWCQIATSGRKHLPVAPDAPLSAFAAISADYPVFRIEPIS